MDKNKVLRLNSTFSINKKELPAAGDPIESIFIEGYASTAAIDRHGDVIPKSAWENGMANYLANPIILAYHDCDDPIGRMVDHKVDDKGLWIKARISAAAEETFNLIKDGVLTAFSVGFRIMDAEYNSVAEVFIIKALELIEISVVSVPANQETIFDLSKAFDSPSEYKKFKEQFAPTGKQAKGPVSSTVVKSETTKEWNMNPEELKKMLEDAASAAAERATKALEERVAAQKAAEAAAAAEKARLESAVKSAVTEQVQTISTGAEKLLNDVKAKIEADTAESKKALDALVAEVREKAEELNKLQASKMNFSDKNNNSGASYEEREKAVMLAKITGKSIEATKYGRAIVEKAGAHVPSATWELEVSLQMEAEVRRRLVMAPLIRSIAMQTNVMTIPVNPEAGKGTWVTNAQFGTDSSAGAAQTHQLKEITLNAYKVATREYMAYEEEEDSLLALMPVVRDAMVRRVARAVDAAFINGAGSGADPVKGIALYDVTSAVTVTNTGNATVATMRSLRKDLGAWGLDPAEIVFVVSQEVYYDLLDDTTFQTMNQVGPQATLLTGQIGQIGNSPVIVSGEMPSKAGGAATASTNIGAFCFAPANFIVGNQRGLRMDTQDLVETQRRVLVASLRTGMTQLTSNLGVGVSTLRWS